MSVFQHNPDNIIYVRVGEETYADKEANFILDCVEVGIAYSGLPTGKVDRIYLTDAPAQHTVADSRGNTDHLPHPYSDGDMFIAKVAELLAAQAFRVPPSECHVFIDGAWVIDVALYKVEKLRTLREEYQAAMGSGVTYDATLFQSDTVSSVALTETLTALSNGWVAPVGFAWVDTDNVAHLADTVWLQGLSAVMADSKATLFKRLQAAKQSVGAAIDVISIDAAVL